MFEENDVLNNTYQIMRPIGRGGMGLVYLAYHIRLQKYVVVKRITKHFGGVPLRTEVDILKNLHHPNLPQVYDFVQDGTSVYTVIDYVDGQDLESYINSGEAVSEQQILRWLHQIADVLSYLHGQPQPILHTDIKPSNIIINSAGDAVLIDFNISLTGDAQGVIGYTLPYSSPEQVEIAHAYENELPWDAELDCRTDIYSLGACFYHLISGFPPDAEQQSFPLSQMDLGYSEALLRIIDKMMRINPNQRYASTKKLLSAIEKARHQDLRYRAYFALQCAVFFLGVLLICGGLYCLIVGVKGKNEDRFRAEISVAYASYTAGNAQKAESECIQVLNNSGYDKLLEAHPEDQCRLLRILGDIAYEKGEYTAAGSYYEQALKYAADRSDETVCMRGMILSYAENGNLTEAQELLEKAKQQGLDNDNLLLIETVLYARSSQMQKCLDAAAELVRTCRNEEICSRACLAAASVAPDLQTQIDWLEKGLAYGQKRTLYRRLTVAYLKLARQTGSALAARTALEYSQKVVEEDYALKSDWLNHAAALQMNGRTADATRTLENLLQTYPEDYLILMNLAFAYDASGAETLAREYCGRAVAAWQNDVSPDKLPADSEEILSLMELQQKFN